MPIAKRAGKFREQTQAELSVGVGITQNYLSELETGKRKGSLELHQKIAQFLWCTARPRRTVAISGKEADPARFAKRKRVVADMKRLRGPALTSTTTFYSAACNARVAFAGLGAPTRSRRSDSDKRPPNAINTGPIQINSTSGL